MNDLEQSSLAQPSLDIEDTAALTVPQEELELPREDMMSPLSDKHASSDAFYTAALSGASSAEELFDIYRKTHTDLTTFGISEDMEVIKNILQTEGDEDTRRVMMETLSNQSISKVDRASILQRYLSNPKSFEVHARQAHHDATLADSKPKTAADRERKINYFSWVPEREAANKAIAAENNRAAAGGSLKTLDNIRDMLLIMAPEAEGILATAAKEAASGEQGWFDRIVDTVFAGNTIQEIRDTMEKTPYHKRAALVKAINGALDDVYLGDINRMYIREDLFAADYPTWRRYVANAVGILDATLIGLPVAKALRGWMRARKGTLTVHTHSPLGTTVDADKDQATKLAAAAIATAKTDNEVAKALAGDVGTIVAETVLPKVPGGASAKYSDEVTDELARLDQDLTNVYKATDSQGINTTHAAKVEAQRTHIETLDTLSGPKLHLNKSWIQDGGILRPLDVAVKEGAHQAEKYHILAMYGETTASGYKTAKEALDAGLKTDIEPSAVRVFYKDMASGALLPYDPSKVVATAVKGAESAPLSGITKIKSVKDDVITVLKGTQELKLSREAFEQAVGVTLPAKINWAGVQGIYKKAAAKVPKGEASVPGVKPISDEFYFGLRQDHTYNSIDAAMFGGDAVAPWGRWRGAGYLFDIVSRFDEQISSMFLYAKNQGTSIERNMMKGVERSISNLDNKEKGRLFKALNAGSEQAKEWDSSALATRFGLVSDKEQLAYYAFRKTSDMLHHMANRTLSKKLKAEGMVRINNLDDSEVFYAKPLAGGDNLTGRVVYDPAEGVVKTLSKKDVQALYDQGGTVAKLRKNHAVSGESVSHIMVDGNTIKLRDIPDNPMNYVTGYFQRTYKDSWFVRQVPLAVKHDGVIINDGVEILNNHSKAVAAYSSKKQADEAARRLSAETGIPHKADLADEYNIDKFAEDFKLYSENMRHEVKRGKRLAGGGPDGFADIEDPIESLIRNIRVVSDHASMDDTIRTMQNSWEKTYGHMVQGGKFPKDIEDIKKTLAKKDGEYGSAVAIKELLDTVNNVPALTDKAYQRVMFEVANILDKTPLGGISQTVRKAGNTGALNPFVISRKLATQFYISMNPLRQIMIQPGQLLQWSLLEPSYYAKGFTRELAALSMAAATIRFSKKNVRTWEPGALKGAARAAGMTDEEFAKLATTYFDRSGLPWSVDANMYVKDITRSAHTAEVTNPLLKPFSAVAKGYNKVVDSSKDLGFTPGEFLNLTGSWLIARRRWMRDNPELASRWHEKTFADQISANASKISYAMTQPGSFAYQKGVLATALQFIAVPHKALLSVTTNKYWSKADKFKIVGANVGMFGAYGLGLNHIYEQMVAASGGEPLEPWLERLLKGGLVDLAFNGVINNVMNEKPGEETRINFANAFSPFAGSPVGPLPWYEVFKKFVDGDWTKVIMGPSYNITHLQDGKFAKVVGELQRITETPDVSSPLKVALAAESILGVTSGVSNLTKWRLGMWYDKAYTSKQQDLGVGMTPTEFWGKLFGFETAAERANFDFLAKFRDDDQALADSFSQYYDTFMSVQTKSGADENLAKQRLADVSTLLLAYTPDEIKRLEKTIMSRLMKETNPEKNFMTLLSKRYLSKAGLQEFYDALNASAYPQAYKDKWKDLIEKGLAHNGE